MPTHVEEHLLQAKVKAKVHHGFTVVKFDGSDCMFSRFDLNCLICVLVSIELPSRPTSLVETFLDDRND